MGIFILCVTSIWNPIFFRIFYFGNFRCFVKRYWFAELYIFFKLRKLINGCRCFFNYSVFSYHIALNIKLLHFLKYCFFIFFFLFLEFLLSYLYVCGFSNYSLCVLILLTMLPWNHCYMIFIIHFVNLNLMSKLRINT